MANFGMSPSYLRDQKQDGSVLAIGELVRREQSIGWTRATQGIVDGIVTSIYPNGELEVTVGGLAQDPNGVLAWVPWSDGTPVYQDLTNPHLMSATGNLIVGKVYAGTTGDWYNEWLLFEVIHNPAIGSISWINFGSSPILVGNGTRQVYNNMPTFTLEKTSLVTVHYSIELNTDWLQYQGITAFGIDFTGGANPDIQLDVSGDYDEVHYNDIQSESSIKALYLDRSGSVILPAWTYTPKSMYLQLWWPTPGSAYIQAVPHEKAFISRVG